MFLHQLTSVADALLNFATAHRFLPSTDIIYPVPFRNVPFFGKAPGPLEPCVFNPVRQLCPQCGRNTYIILTIGANPVNYCFFCRVDSGLPLGINQDAVIRRGKTVEAKDSVYGMAHLANPCPTHFHITAKTHIDNELSSLINRGCAATPYVTDADFQYIIDIARRDNHSILPFDEVDHHWMDFPEWLQHTKISPANKAEILAAWEEFEGMDGNAWELIRHCQSSAFTKKDKDKPGFKTRLISGMEPIITALLGYFVSSFQITIEHMLNHNLLFAAGKVNEDLNRWRASVPDGYYPIAIDMTNFDTLIKKQHNDLVMFQYREFLRYHPHPSSKFILRVLRHQKYTMRGKTGQGLSYFVPNTMKSGSSGTCIDNTLVNFWVVLGVLAEENGLTVGYMVNNKLVYMTAMGDDNLMFLHPNIRSDQMQRRLEDLGMMPKIIRSGPNVEVFLNMVPVPTTDGLVYTPLVGRAFARIMTTLSNPRDPLAHIAGVVECLLPSIHHNPVYDAWFARLWHLTGRGVGGRNHHRGVSDSVHKDLNTAYKVLAQSKHEMCSDTIPFLCDRYGLSTEEISSAIAFLKTVELGTPLTHPAVIRIMEVDTTSPSP